MTPRLILTFGMSALMFGGTMVGCTGGATGRIASASDRNDALSAKAAAASADKAVRALGKRDLDTAVRMAEGAVAMAPRDAGYRMLLGQSYLQAGRFTSARAAFADVLQLYPANGKAALNLALAQIATGDWSAAQATLTAHAAIIPVGDLGLATALAGNPARAVDMLNAAARAPGATAKVRQNLALSYALAGQWNMARVAAAADMSPADLDARLEQWAAFAQPRGASDQVASLLGVTPAPDTGLPVALALNAAVPVGPVAEAPVQVAAAEPPAVPASAKPPEALFAKVTFAPRSEVVQPLTTMLIRADATPAKLALGESSAGRVVQMVPAARPFVRDGRAGGDWYVQIGAFSNIAVAKSGWNTATRRFAALSGHQPTGTTVSARQGSLYRVSVGGFTRDQADEMCRAYRGKGGACFVRREAGDRMAQWLRARVQMASR